MNINLSDLATSYDGREEDNSWQEFVNEIRKGNKIPFEAQLETYNKIYKNRKVEDGPPKVWLPGEYEKTDSNIARFMKSLGIDNLKDLYEWSVNSQTKFWNAVIKNIGFSFSKDPEQTIDLSGGRINPVWFPGAKLNCVDNCFTSKADKIAIISGKENSSSLTKITYGELERLVNRVSNGLVEHGFVKGDRIALYMPMTPLCVAAYLGIIKAGCQVVSIADSFSATEIRKRIEISNAKAIITEYEYSRSGKTIKPYEKVKAANIEFAIVIGSEKKENIKKFQLRANDLHWHEFLSVNESFESIVCEPYSFTNILFSSGTTGTPKAIPWNHLTPLKCATDGYFYQDIHESDVVAWPTNIGWMMGPWLIYASLINKATIALYEGAPLEKGFISFVKNAKVNIMGLIPSLVKKWRISGLIQQSEWKNIRVFSSTGEPSNSEDYFWLMSRTDFRAPVIEYMGGTEIGGGYITGTVLQPASPSMFTTPALGLDIVLLNENGLEAKEGEKGEVFIAPPSIGLSQEILNQDHFEVYYKNCPTDSHGNLLRRHGDQIRILYNGFYQAQGRTDDTMNLGGIKVSSVEIEEVVILHKAVFECAAVSIQTKGESIEKLVIFVVLIKEISVKELLFDLKTMISKRLNPLFKIYDLVITDELPKTASGKLMRRKLRNQYMERKF